MANEIIQTVADLALEFGVSVFIYSSIERRGDQFDDEQTLSGLAKVNIERYVRQLGTKGLPWTYVLPFIPARGTRLRVSHTYCSILRPAFFMENYNGKIGSITAGVLKAGLKPTTAIALIVRDSYHVLLARTDVAHTGGRGYRSRRSRHI